MSQGCALLILRSKGQRSRSWRMVIWKWFPDDNWLCNQPMIMKLHTLTHHESRMRPIDFEVQRSRSWRMVIWKWFPDDNWLCNQPMIMKLHTLTPHDFVGVGGGPVLLQQYFQYAFICCPYMLPLLLYHRPKRVRLGHASSNQIIRPSGRPFVCLSICYLVPPTYKLQYLRGGVGQGQTVGLWYFAHFDLIAARGNTSSSSLYVFLAIWSKINFGT